jgi:C4-dicarboxylate-specific signal transduction histidine kinase
MHLAVDNLATEFLKSGRQLAIRLSYSISGGSRALSVSDSETGLPPELLQTTESPPREALAKGVSALGLVLVDSFAAQIGGSIERSSGPGGGTCFKVRFQGL